MRVIAGSAGGRRITVPGTGTRPTSDRVRESVFSILEGLVDDWSAESVLDVYAGSGSLGLEALSRGAASAVFVDSDRRAAAVVARNCADLGLPGEVLDVPAARIPRAEHPVSLVFLDPPYDVPDADVATVVSRLRERGWFADGTLLVLERGDASFEWSDDVEALVDRRYGATHIRIAVFRAGGGSMATRERDDI